MGRGQNEITAVASRPTRTRKPKNGFRVRELNFVHHLEYDYDTGSRSGYDYYSDEPDYYYSDSNYQEISNARVEDNQDYKAALRGAIAIDGKLSEIERFALDQFVEHTDLQLSADSFTADVVGDYYGDIVESIILEDTDVENQIEEFLNKFSKLTTARKQAECLLKLAYNHVPQALENKRWEIESVTLASLAQDNELLENPAFQPRYFNKAIYGLGRHQDGHIILVHGLHQVPVSQTGRRTIKLLVAQ